MNFLRVSHILALGLLAALQSGDAPTGKALAQQGSFELPVQLIGFPVIIIAVRLSNFIKKLSYAFSPSTYRSRSRRDLLEGDVNDGGPIDAAEVEKRLVQELGERVCIYESVCLAYAEEAKDYHEENNRIFDWQDIFRKYETAPRGKGEFYLLSVFLGDIVGSPGLCRQLAKRGRSCDEVKLPPFPHDPTPTTQSHPSPPATTHDLAQTTLWTTTDRTQ